MNTPLPHDRGRIWAGRLLLLAVVLVSAGAWFAWELHYSNRQIEFNDSMHDIGAMISVPGDSEWIEIRFPYYIFARVESLKVKGQSQWRDLCALRDVWAPCPYVYVVNADVDVDDLRALAEACGPEKLSLRNVRLTAKHPVAAAPPLVLKRIVLAESVLDHAGMGLLNSRFRTDEFVIDGDPRYGCP